MGARNNRHMYDEVYAQLTGLIALSPEGDAPVNALVRATCARAISLPALVAEGEPAGDEAIANFAEQFAVDVSTIGREQRVPFYSASGANSFRVVSLMFIADFVPRVQAGLTALGLPPIADPVAWDPSGDPSDLVLNRFAATVGALRGLDPVTTEVVRLRGAAQHNCRLCKSRREVTAMDAGGSESLYDDIERYESSTLVDERHKAALRYVDALIWTPSAISSGVAAGVHAHFSDVEALEITFDVMRNAANKILVAFGKDAPLVEEGTELFELGVDGEPVYA